MKNYFIDANFILRHILQDNLKQAAEVKKYLKLAKEGKNSLTVISEVIIEIEYVLRKVYGVPREEIGNILIELFKNDLFVVEKKVVLLKSLNTYIEIRLDLVDIMLLYQSQEDGSYLLTFDKKLKKLASKL